MGVLASLLALPTFLASAAGTTTFQASWKGGQCLAWDATVINTPVAESVYIRPAEAVDHN